MSDTEDNNIFSEYEEYTKLEQHMSLSKSLYTLDKKGCYLIEEITKKKNQGTRTRRGSSTTSYIFTDDISIIHNNIMNCLSVKRLKMYFCLQYFLDELLYHEVKKSSNFYIEDNSYNIAKIYFGQNEWITDIFIQNFQFYQTSTLNINEAMYLVCYLKDFDRFLLDIEEYIKPFKDIKRIKNKLHDIIHRIRFRHQNIWGILVNIINQNISRD